VGSAIGEAVGVAAQFQVPFDALKGMGALCMDRLPARRFASGLSDWRKSTIAGILENRIQLRNHIRVAPGLDPGAEAATVVVVRGASG